MAQRWYVVHVYSTFEQKVANQIKEQSTLKGMEDSFSEILVPIEEIIDVKNGKKVSKESRLFPGYILVRMEMTDETWYLVCSISKVTGFLGTGNRPTPMSDAEAQRLVQQLEEGVATPRSSVVFEIGEQIRVNDGPFAGFNGNVDEVDPDRARLKVIVQIFERDTPIDLEYEQVEKI